MSDKTIHIRPEHLAIADAIATVQYSRQTHVGWAAYLRQHPDYVPGAIGEADYHEQAVREYDNVLAVLDALTSPAAEEAS